MEITRIFKSKPFDVAIGIAGWEVKLTNKDLGWPEPKNPKEAYDMALAMGALISSMVFSLAASEGVVLPEIATIKIERMNEACKGPIERIKKLTEV